MKWFKNLSDQKLKKVKTTTQYQNQPIKFIEVYILQ